MLHTAKKDAKDASKEIARAKVTGDKKAEAEAKSKMKDSLKTIGKKGGAEQKDRYAEKTGKIEERTIRHEAKSTLKQSQKDLSDAVRSGDKDAFDAARDQRDRSSKFLKR